MKKAIGLLLSAAIIISLFVGVPAAAATNYGITTLRTPVYPSRLLQFSASVFPIKTASDYGNILTLSPTHALYTLDENLNVTDEAGSVICNIDTAIKHLEKTVIPAFSIETQALAEAFCEFENGVTLYDCLVVSSNPEIVKYVREHTTYTLCAIDFRNMDFGEELSADEMMQIRGTVNKNHCKIALISQKYTTREVCEYLQKRCVTVWADASTDKTETDAAETLTTGVNGMVITNREIFENVYNKLTMRLPIFRQPIVIGHRGNPSTYCENTVESSMIAYEGGADIIENDIHLSKDGVLFVMHDGNISRTTDGQGNVEDLTYDELRSYTMNGTNGTPIPTLEEYFTAFKGLDVQLFVEIKGDGQPLIDELVRLIDEYEFLDQISVISFNQAQLTRLYATLPEISLGYLCNISGSLNDSVTNALTWTKAYDSTINPEQADISNKNYAQLTLRGFTLWPWTYGTLGDIPYDTSRGASGITTNVAADCAGVPTVASSDKTLNAKIGDTVTPKLTFTTFDGKTLTGDEYYENKPDASNLIILLEGEDKVKINDDASFTVLKAGKISYMTAAKCLTNADGSGMKGYYYIFSQPTTVTVPTVLGDIGLNGKVELSDAMLVFKYVAGKTSFTDEQKNLADMNGDGRVSLVDSMIIFSEVAKKH